ncbi:MAG: hypothetical protein WBG90_21860 [Saonia sp.]
MDYFFDILQTAYVTAYTSTGMTRKFIEPRIYHGGPNFDLSKRWYVYYSYEHPTKKNKDGTPAMKRQPTITLSINRKYKTKSERLYHLGTVRNVLHEMFQEGCSQGQVES